VFADANSSAVSARELRGRQSPTRMPTRARAPAPLAAALIGAALPPAALTVVVQIGLELSLPRISPFACVRVARVFLIILPPARGSSSVRGGSCAASQRTLQR
jgi:hypothetical protein